MNKVGTFGGGRTKYAEAMTGANISAIRKMCSETLSASAPADSYFVYILRCADGIFT
jgi:hypothetical protein